MKLTGIYLVVFINLLYDSLDRVQVIRFFCRQKLEQRSVESKEIISEMIHELAELIIYNDLCLDHYNFDNKMLTAIKNSVYKKIGEDLAYILNYNCINIVNI